MMSSSNPRFALAYVRELSADFLAGIVIDEAGTTLAGDPALSVPARALLDAHPHARQLHGTARDGTQVFAARGGDGAIVVVTGPLALPALTARDLRLALSKNAAESVQEPPLERPEQALVDRLTTVVADAFRP